MITKIYKINNSNKKELNQICELFSNNSYQDHQYKKISKDQNKIKELIKIQTKQLLQSNNNSIEIYSPNDKLQSIIILINTKDKDYAKKIFSNKNSIKQFKQIKKQFSYFKTIKILINTIKTNNALKKLISKSDYLLYNIIVDNKAKGQGHATKLLNPILNKFDNEKLTCKLLTHNPSNTHIYEHFGFKIDDLKTENKIKNYIMIRHPQINKIRIKKQF